MPAASEIYGPKYPDWWRRCGAPPDWLVLGALFSFPEGLGEARLVGIRPGTRTWEAMGAKTSRWFEIDALDYLGPPVEGYRPWPGPPFILKIGAGDAKPDRSANGSAKP